MSATPETLTGLLTRSGADAPIVRAMAEAPRETFVPERVWPGDFGAPLERADDPEAWAELVYSDTAITTQANEHGIPTSSTSQPSLMAHMLRAADIRPGHRVLEVGTATGWNAAIMSRLGAEVVSVEVDPDLAERARDRLHGYRVAVVTGDGATPPPGPYDRAIATCAVTRIPAAWVGQTVDGGRIVTPWKPSPDLPGGVLLGLEVTGGTARGRVLGEASFMLSRSTPRGGRPADLDAEPDSVRTVDGDPRDTVMHRHAGPVLALTVPGWRVGMRVGSDGDRYVWGEDADGRSWMRLHGTGLVESSGPRDLWADLVAAREAWEKAGSPPLSEYGVSVEPDGRHRVWLGAPDHPGWTH